MDWLRGKPIARNATQAANPLLYPAVALVPMLGYTGTSVLDRARPGGGVLTNMSTATDWLRDSKYGPVLDFDGTDDRLIARPINVGTRFTIHCLVYLRTTGVGKLLVTDRTASFVGPQFWFTIAGASSFQFYVQNTNVSSSDATLPANAWYHCTVTYAARTVRFYVNGVPDSGNPKTLAADPAYGGDSLHILYDPINNVSTDAQLAAAYIFRRALSGQEIRSLVADPLLPLRAKGRVAVGRRAGFTPQAMHLNNLMRA